MITLSEEFAGGLHIITSVAWLPDGRMLANENAVNNNTGTIRVIERDGTLLSEPLYTTPVVGGNGLSGMVLHPAFEENGHLFVWVARPGNTVHELRRLTVDISSLEVTEEVAMFEIDNPGASTFRHGQTNMQFGPDGRLIINLGDAEGPLVVPEIVPPLSQDLTNFWGTVFVVDVEGPIPIDVSEPWNFILTYGHRNQFGLAVHPTLGTMWVTENGPIDDDELNYLVPGRNYGWPYVTGEANLPIFQDPAIVFTQVIAPVDCTHYTGDVYPPEYRDDLYYWDFLRGGFHHTSLSGPDLDTVESEELWFDDNAFGFLTAVAEGPDGLLHFASQPVKFDPGPSTSIYRITYTPPPGQADGVTLR